MWRTMNESEEGLKILARIIARAYLADKQGNNTTPRIRRIVKKHESLRRTIRGEFNRKGRDESKGQVTH